MKTGNCDLCGRWSSDLYGGACPECRLRYGLVEPVRRQPALPAVALRDGRLSARDLRVLGALAALCDPVTGAFEAGREALRQVTGLPVTKISSATTRLQARGLITKEPAGRRVRIRLAETMG